MKNDDYDKYMNSWKRRRRKFIIRWAIKLGLLDAKER